MALKKDLSIDFLGVRCENPFFLSSSPVCSNYEMIAKAYEAGWGGVFYKTIGVFIPDECSPRFDITGQPGGPWAGFKNMEMISDKPLETNLEYIRRLKKDFPEKQIAAEAENAAEGLAYIAAGVDSLQCERFSPAELAQFVKEAKGINPQVTVLAAGGINSDNAAAYATAGADVLVTSWVYFGKPQDIKMSFSRG